MKQISPTINLTFVLECLDEHVGIFQLLLEAQDGLVSAPHVLLVLSLLFIVALLQVAEPVGGLAKQRLKLLDGLLQLLALLLGVVGLS